jgi:hypothetical protein
LLALLRAAANQNHKPIAISGEVDSIAGAEGDLVFKNPPDPVRTNAKPKLPNEPNSIPLFQHLRKPPAHFKSVPGGLLLRKVTRNSKCRPPSITPAAICSGRARAMDEPKPKLPNEPNSFLCFQRTREMPAHFGRPPTGLMLRKCYTKCQIAAGCHHHRKPLRGGASVGEPYIGLPNEPNLIFCFQQRKNGKANSTEPINRLPENFLPTTALAEQIPRPADVSSPTLL